MATIEELKARREKLDEQIKQKKARLEQQVGAYFLKQFKFAKLKEAREKIDELVNLEKASDENLNSNFTVDEF